MRQGGGLSAFFFTLTSEANAVARAHAAALGGNAVISFRLNPRESSRGRSRNQVRVNGHALLRGTAHMHCISDEDSLA